MLLQYKVYMIGGLYFMGILFMTLFPPRNFEMSGAKMREIRMSEDDIQYPKYIDYNTLLQVTGKIGVEDSEIAKVIHLSPKTFKNNSIIALELRSDTNTKKPGILIIGAINGMSWGAPNAIIELAEKLVHDTKYQTPFFNDYDWYLVPMANPDGITFTKTLNNFPAINTTEWSRNISTRAHTRPSYWYKNIEVQSEHNSCFGTNINRNFAYHWQDDVHKTPNLCSQHYPGEKPFTTAEAQAIRAYVDKLGDNIHMVIHLHASFVPKKEYILYPWRYTLRQPSNYRNLQAIGEYAARQARLPDGRLYEVHQASSDGRVAGTLSDYLSGVIGIELVYIVKPYYPPFPNQTDVDILEQYVKKSISVILSLVRGWRSSTKLNTLSFFGRDVEF